MNRECGETAYYCICRQSDDHDGPHVCAASPCLGIWTGSGEDGTLEVVRYPTGQTGVMDALFYALELRA